MSSEELGDYILVLGCVLAACNVVSEKDRVSPVRFLSGPWELCNRARIN
jgi:hypothetical protein